MSSGHSTDAALRVQLVHLINGDGGAHVSFDDAVAELPVKLRGTRPEGLPYSPWEQLEHMRIAQWDILEFCRSDRHRSPTWPNEYWPPEPAPPDRRAWGLSIAAFRRDNEQMQKLVSDRERDLFEPFAWGDGQTLLREAMLVADHNSYHLGQLIAIRRLLGAWHG